MSLSVGRKRRLPRSGAAPRRVAPRSSGASGGGWLRWALVAPTIALLLAMTAFPFAYAVYISLHRWKTTFPVRPWVGTDNYVHLLTDDDRFWNGVVKTLVIGASALTLEFVFGLVLAVIFWRTFERARWLATLVLLPMMISPVVVGFTARMAFNDSYGFVNQIVSLFVPGDFSVQWLSDGTLAPIVIILADAWQWGPFVFLLLLAGLLATSSDAVEAAVIDGARPHQVLWHVVLPGMKYIMIVTLVLRGLDLMRMFDVIALATRGGPGIGTETLTFYIYNLGFKFFDLGLAAAASILMLIGVSLLVGLAIRSLNRGAPA